MKLRVALPALALVAACATTTENAGGGVDILPGADVSAFLSEVETVSTRGDEETISLAVTDVSRDSIYAEAVEEAKARGESVDIPLQSANELIVLLRPDLTREEAEGAYAAVRALPADCNASKTLPEIGAIVVACGDLVAADDGYDLARTRAAEINQYVERLRRDERFAAVAANSVVTTTQISSVVYGESDRSGEELGETADWGIAASKIDMMWPLLTQSVQVGVIDGGFADHTDLPLVHGLPGPWASGNSANHGNHVSGIMCARHNGFGVKGVLPNCQVAAASGNFMLRGSSTIEGDDVIAWQARFSEYVATVLDFIEANPDAKVINLSLGYNWLPNFGKDPRKPENADLRDIVKGQGRIFYSILAFAKRRDVAIFAAAGNDSTSLATPLEAEWASPFNYGAKLMREKEGWSNGVVVEAYGQNNRRTSFSNVKGDISCPGARIMSALARPANQYGAMDGTSMASPYCAAGFAALRSLQPQVPMQRALQCYLGVAGRVDGVPKMDLKAAFEACRTP